MITKAAFKYCKHGVKLIGNLSSMDNCLILANRVRPDFEYIVFKENNDRILHYYIRYNNRNSKLLYCII